MTHVAHPGLIHGFSFTSFLCREFVITLVCIAEIRAASRQKTVSVVFVSLVFAELSLEKNRWKQSRGGFPCGNLNNDICVDETTQFVAISSLQSNCKSAPHGLRPKGYASRSR